MAKSQEKQQRKGGQTSPKPFVYKAAVRPDSIYRWVVLVILLTALTGFTLAQLLVSQRTDQLVAETASRVQLQGENRARLVQEWLAGVQRAGDTIAGAEVVKAFVGDPEMAPSREAAEAAQAQKPYLQQTLKEFLKRANLEGAHLLDAQGQVVLSEGTVAEPIATERAAFNESLKGKGIILPLRNGKEGIVMDILRPIRPIGEEEGPGIGVLWYTAKVSQPFVALLTPSPLDRKGERTALVQADPKTTDMYIVGKDAMGSLGQTMQEITDMLNRGKALSLSMVDGLAVFATLVKVAGTPFSVLQEYKAADALAVMRMFKPGIYTIVILMVGVLGGTLAALTLHLLSNRNKTRVRLLEQTIDAMVKVVEARDPHLMGHHKQVARLALNIGNMMGKTVEERATLYYAGLLSAIGRIFVPRNLIAKDKTLSKAERTEMEHHVAAAMAVLDEMHLDLPVAPVIQQMYEREDGKGYPFGLRGSAIHPLAKILAIADAFVALTNDRPHRKAFPSLKALDILEEGPFTAEMLKALQKALKQD